LEERQDVTKHLQNPPPSDLGGKRKYIRKLLEAFEPHQEAMFADLDRQIEESNPDIVSRQFDELSKQLEKKNKQWEQIMKDLSQVEKTERKIVETTLIALLDEIIALNPTHLTLYRQIQSTTRQNTVLKYKREHRVELLQTMHTMRQEGDWEKIGEKEKNPYEFVLIGERFLCFQFTKQKLRYEPIEDIYEWMNHYRPDFLPVEEAEEEESTPKKPAKTAQRKRPVATKQPLPSISPAQNYERQAWIRLLVSAHHYSSYFQDPLGELGGFVYDKDKDKSQATLHLWANGTKQQFPVLEGAISQQEMLTDTMRSWLALSWEAATGRAGRREGPQYDAQEITKSDPEE
jgi:TolA-binding protein